MYLAIPWHILSTKIWQIIPKIIVRYEIIVVFLDRYVLNASTSIRILMMIKLTKEFSCERDGYGWCLIRERPATGRNPKTGEPATGMTVKRTYHSNMEQVLNYLLDASCSNISETEADDIQSLKNFMDTTRKQMLDIIPPQFKNKKSAVIRIKNPLRVTKPQTVKKADFPSWRRIQED